jgi:hypothetical protein
MQVNNPATIEYHGMTTPVQRGQPTILGLLPNDLAPAERARLFGGLEAFVNGGDTPQDFNSLASQWPTFWPHDIDEGGNPNRLNWSLSAHPLFLDYRDKLRKVWEGDPEARLSSVLAYLLGIVRINEFMSAEYVLDVDAAWFGRELDSTHRAWQSLLQTHPEALQAPHSMAFPQWGLGNLRYLPRTDFEQALWLLCQENWRARVCGQCKRYFIADKAAQKYCSTRCYGQAKRGQRLEWWNSVGKIKRSQKRSSLRSRSQRTHARRERTRRRGTR